MPASFALIWSNCSADSWQVLSRLRKLIDATASRVRTARLSVYPRLLLDGICDILNWRVRKSVEEKLKYDYKRENWRALCIKIYVYLALLWLAAFIFIDSCLIYINFPYLLVQPLPVAAQSKAWVCGRSPAEIVGSNPARGMNVWLLWVLCMLSGRGLCDELITHPKESYRLWCVVVCEWGGHSPRWAAAPEEKKIFLH